MLREHTTWVCQAFTESFANCSLSLPFFLPHPTPTSFFPKNVLAHRPALERATSSVQQVTGKCFCVGPSLGPPSSEGCPEKHLDNRSLTSGSVPRLPRGFRDKKPIQKLSTELILWIQIAHCSVFSQSSQRPRSQASRQLSTDSVSQGPALRCWS